MNSVTNEYSSSDYCINKAATDGSNLYYASLFESEETKRLIIPIHAFIRDVSDIIHECSDPGVARIKLNWWHEELERLLNNQPRHPITTEINKNINYTEEVHNTLNKIVDEFENFIFIEQDDSFNNSLVRYISTTGELWIQSARLIGLREKTSLNMIRDTGALYHFLACLQQPNDYINETRCIIPATYADKSTILDLRQRTSPNKLTQTEVFSPLLEEIKSRFDDAYKNLPKPDRVPLKHMLILNRLAAKTCEEILRDGCILLNTRVSLTPIRKLWTAWRTHLAINYAQVTL